MNIPTLLRRISALFAIVLLCASPAVAQGKWWQSEKFTRELKLTQEQSRRLEDIFQSSLPALRTHKKSLDEAETKFAALMERGGDQQIMIQLNYVETARAELNKARVMMQLRMKNALTTDQWAKFTALHQAADRERLQREHPGSAGAATGK
jgi:Spy/CpxP family protein refolding chaperone